MLPSLRFLERFRAHHNAIPYCLRASAAPLKLIRWGIHLSIPPKPSPIQAFGQFPIKVSMDPQQVVFV